MEPAVKAAGALPTLISTGVLAVLWAVPQCLFIAELASMFDVNGGFVVVRRCRCFIPLFRGPRFPAWLADAVCALISPSLPLCLCMTLTMCWFPSNCSGWKKVRCCAGVLRVPSPCSIGGGCVLHTAGLGRFGASICGYNAMFSSWLDNPVSEGAREGARERGSEGGVGVVRLGVGRLDGSARIRSRVYSDVAVTSVLL
jgi:hypothetical protein